MCIWRGWYYGVSTKTRECVLFNLGRVVSLLVCMSVGTPAVIIAHYRLI